MNSFLLVALALYIVGFGYFVYFCMLADPDESKTADFWTRRVPLVVSSRLGRVVGTKNMEHLQLASGHFLQILYLVVVLGSWSIMFAYAYPWVTESTYVANYHKFVGYLVFAACMSSWRVACHASPGIITARTVELYNHYPYDGFLFVPDRICPTVGIKKLARSKYDRFSKQHIARFDHFCGWLYNPIGQENYRFFLLFLLVHVLMCLYGTAISARLFWGEILELGLLEATFFNMHTGEEFTGSWYIISQYMLGRHFYLSGVLLLMACMTLVLGGFLGYHCYITSIGMTTNEAAKWKQVKSWHKQEMKRYKHAVSKGLVVVSTTSTSSTTSSNPDKVGSDGDVGCTEVDPSEIQDNNGEPPIMDPGPMPTNIYNQGFVANWADVLFPQSLRRENIEKWTRLMVQDQTNNSTVARGVREDNAGKTKAN